MESRGREGEGAYLKRGAEYAELDKGHRVDVARSVEEKLDRSGEWSGGR
jgi:hypothetical protein